MVEEELEYEQRMIFIYYKDGSSEFYCKSDGYEWDLTDNLTIIVRSKKEEIIIPWIDVKKVVVKNGIKSSEIQNRRKITCLEV